MVGGGPLGAAAPPRGQGGHQGGQRLLVQSEVGAERGQVAALHGRPEGGVRTTVGARVGRVRGEGGVGPVAAALEGVRRQVDAAGTGAVQGAAPVDAGAPHVQPGEGRGEAGDLVAVAAERGEDGDGRRAVRTATVAVEDRAGRGGQGAVGAQLQ